MIRLENVSYAIGGTSITENLSLTIPKGKVTALIGPNGAGKSTVLSLIARLIRPQAGQVYIDDLDVQRAAADVLAKKLSVLRQENVISSRLSVRDLVGFGRYPYHKGRPSENDRLCVDVALEKLEISDLSHRFLDELSGGQKQRTLIAMILCQQTDYVLLDEPLNNLDLVHARQLMRTVSSASAKEGTTVVIVLHDINYAAQYADNIVGIRDGNIQFQGPTELVFNKSKLSELFGADVPVQNMSGELLAMHY